jgi:hypothetical protein
MSAEQTYVSVALPDIPPTMNAQPLLQPEADEAVVAQPWLYRSEGFAEDLADWQPADEPLDDAASLPARLAWPLSALVLGIGLVVGLGL